MQYKYRNYFTLALVFSYYTKGYKANSAWPISQCVKREHVSILAVKWENFVQSHKWRIALALLGLISDLNWYGTKIKVTTLILSIIILINNGIIIELLLHLHSSITKQPFLKCSLIECLIILSFIAIYSYIFRKKYLETLLGRNISIFK